MVFGSYAYAKDRLYFIADWTDDYCDLTLSKVVEKLKETSPEFELAQVPEMDEAFYEKIRGEVLARHKRLEETNRSNWRDQEAKEDVSKAQKPWWKKFFK